jgi:predicted DNA-binding ribbon-helix-helix protein
MDQGIIQNLKVHYRKLLLRERIAKIDEEKDFSINLLQALRILKRAWDAVKPETIRKCFKHAGFVIEDQVDI